MIQLPPNVTIVVPFGFAGSGKGYVYETLVQHTTGTKTRVVKLAFSDLLKDVVALLFGWDRELLAGTTAVSRAWREQVDPYWDDRLHSFWGQPITPRYVLQRFGTEVVRQTVHADFWVLALERRLQTLIQQAGQFDETYIVIDDCRFLNEAQMVLQYDRTRLIFLMRSLPVWVQTVVYLMFPTIPCSVVSREAREWFVGNLQQCPAQWQQYARESGVHQSEWDWFSFFTLSQPISILWNDRDGSIWEQLQPILA